MTALTPAAVPHPALVCQGTQGCQASHGHSCSAQQAEGGKGQPDGKCWLRLQGWRRRRAAARTPPPRWVSQGSTGTYSQSSFPRCPWGQGHRGDGHLQRRQGGEHGTWVSSGEGVKGRCTPRRDPGTPGWTQGPQDLWEEVPDTFTSLEGETTEQASDALGVPQCLGGPALQPGWIWPGCEYALRGHRDWLGAGISHVPSQRTKALAASSMLRMSQR